MTREDYKRLPWTFEHCPATDCPRAQGCIRHQAMQYLADSTRTSYASLNPYTLRGHEDCQYFVADERQRYAWGISRIYDEVKSKDKETIRLRLIAYFGKSTYYHITSKRKALEPEDQQYVRRVLTEAGYDGARIEFDSYEVEFPFLMHLHKRDKSKG